MCKKIIPLLLVIMMPLSALSHTEIAFLSPENGSILSEAPNEIYIVYHYPVMITKLEMFKSDQDNENIQLSKNFLMQSSDAHQIKLPSLKMGEYEIDWRALSEDGHMIKGTFSFKIK
jgi:methionine-rich copper-binding protein CopC